MRRAKTLASVLRLLLLLVLAVPAVLAAAEPDGGAADRAALLRFKSSVSDPAGLLADWSDSDLCRWPGVTCDAASSRVVSLNISSPGPNRRLAGPIPPEIWRLGSLRTLDLSSNALVGQIPPSISSCTNLETVDLSGNLLTGPLPASLFALPNLKALSLSSNRLSGTLPAKLGSRCPSLEHLDLSRNLFVDAIPAGLGNCTKLRSLILSSNLFSDVIPPELGRLEKLHVLDVSRNCLSGPVPPELGDCVELSVLMLSNPYDPLPAGDDPGYVDSDDFNYFQGGIAESITSLPRLRVLWAPRATLEGEIPRRWGGCRSLEMVNLGGNLFSGEVPEVFEQCWNLKFLNLSSNKLTGRLTEELPVPCMDVFDISANQLSGTIPKFIPRLCSLMRFMADDLTSEYYSFFAHRTQEGMSLPYLDSRDAFVVYHSFSDNNFTGPLPTLPIATERLKVENIYYAFLADRNKLGGQIRDVLFEKCKGLSGLVISVNNNLFFGGIPASTGDMCNALISFNAAGNRITGAIPESVGLLGSLVGLDLRGNKLTGQIPPSFENLKGLKYLLLASNNLSGPIPTGLYQLLSLKWLDLSSNSLSGEIPSGLANLRNLSTLLLENNKLSGEIPPALANVSTLSLFNVSFNNLSGPLPSNAMMRCDSLVGNPLIQPCPLYSLSLPPSGPQGLSMDSQTNTDIPPGSPTNRVRNSGFNSIEIASITSAAAIFSVLLSLIVLYVYTRKCVPRSQVQSSGRRDVTVFMDIGVPITYESVVRATGSFNASNCIGSGGFGATYKAEIAPGVLVAIKRLSVGRFQGVQQFHAEIKTLGRWRHPNLVTLIGYHLSEAEMFLIYNYLPGGNLERFIQERSKRPMDWRMLHKIALDVARALAYLHEYCVPRILHRDVKPSNILLDNDFKAYLSDFGLARLLGNSETHATTGVAGTFGYVAPEYAMTCRVSDKADVYSYGVVLLELISDKKALDPSFSPYGNGFNIVAWACMLLRQGRAREFFTEGLWDVGPHDDLVETLHLAVMCTVETLSIRPTMKQVVQRLKQLQPLLASTVIYPSLTYSSLHSQKSFE